MAASSANVQAAKAYDYVFKLLLVGDSSVGKTCLLFRFCEDTFYSTFISTIGIDFKIKTITLDGKSIKLQIWDTAGQERFRTITTAYYRGAMGIIFVYDITSEQSFSNLKMWLENVEEHASGNVERLIVGNKFDMPAKRQVTLEQANAFARPRSIRVVEVSAKTGENVETAFILIATEIKRKADQKSGATATQTSQAQKTDNDKQGAGTNVRLGSGSKDSNSSDKCAC